MRLLLASFLIYLVSAHTPSVTRSISSTRRYSSSSTPSPSYTAQPSYIRQPSYTIIPTRSPVSIPSNSSTVNVTVTSSYTSRPC